jgi:hypothetical protein
MAKATSPMTGDLATGPIQWRAAKILGEILGRKAGGAIRSTEFGEAIKGIERNLPQGLKDTVGIVGASIIQSPRLFADTAGGFLGLDADKLHELFNEITDSSVLSFLSDEAKAGKNLTESDITKLEKLFEERFKNLESTVVTNDHELAFHRVACHNCLKPSTPKKGGGSSATAYKDGCREVSIFEALRTNYLPTRRDCCKTAVADMTYEAKDTPKLFRSALTGLGQEYVNKYTDFLNGASTEQREKMVEAENRTCTPSDLRGLLDIASNAQEYIARLPKKPVEKPTLKSRVGKALESVFTKGPDAPEVLAIKKTVDGFTKKAAGRAITTRIQRNAIKTDWK